MKRKSLTIIVFAMLALAACNNGSEKTTATDTSKTTAADTTKAAAAEPAKAAEFKPFDVVEITHAVKDYTSWRKGFDADSPARKASGLEFIVIGRGETKPNNLMIVLNAADVQKAKDFAASPRLKDIKKKNGVVSKPAVSYFHVIRFNPDSKEKQWVVVTHKVKDFDAWLKVFDAEGTATRATQGVVDVAMSRGVDDPNTVQLVFDIKDMAKAKAEMGSEAKKKLMMSAGVIGTPKFEFYTTAD